MHLRGVVLCALGLSLALIACSERLAPRDSTNTRKLSGKVLERLDAPPYSFLRLELQQGEAWVAVPVGTAAGSRKVEVTSGILLRNYDAPSIGKRFDQVVFGTVVER